MPASNPELPLAVDLDGSLLVTDTLIEGFCALLRSNPAALPAVLQSAGRGRCALKKAISDSIVLDVTTLPYNHEVLEYLFACRARGRRIGLFTAADQRVAEAVAEHLGIFDVVCGTCGGRNIKGAAKAQVIEQELGPRFAYIGDHPADMPIFAQAEAVLIAGRRIGSLTRRLAAEKVIEAIFPMASAGPGDWIKGLRIKHWAKNGLIFVPLILAGLPSLEITGQAVLLFVLFGMLASATYLINDLLDLAADRGHEEKRHRPLAAGRIPLEQGVLAAVLMLATVGVAAWLWLPPITGLVMAGYFALTLAYSFYLKRQPIADVLALASLFTSRIFAGSVLLKDGASPWLISFSLMFFLSLAQIKRYAELRCVISKGGWQIPARGYSQDDLPLLLSAGVGSALSSTVIFVIYMIQEQYPRHIYSDPRWLWVINPLLLAWLLRTWRLTVHGIVKEDPVLFALKDRVSLGIGVCVAAALVLAWL